MPSKLSAFALTLLILSDAAVQAAPSGPRPPHSVPVSGLSVADNRHLFSDRFKIIKTVQAIPHPVLSELLGKGPRDGMADPGQPFERSDAVGPTPLPFRRLLFAAVSPGYCLVYNEYGGIVEGTEVSFYRLSPGRATLVWEAGLLGTRQSLTLPQLQARIRAGRYISRSLPRAT